MKNGRCHFHGGKSPGAKPGNKNALKHGRFTREAMEARRMARDSTANKTALATRSLNGDPSMTTPLTEGTYLGRKAALRDNLAAAERRFSEAALAAATGEGPVEKQRLAREAVAEVRDQIAALDAAWAARGNQEEAARLEAERKAYAASAVKIEKLADECDQAGKAMGDAFEAMLDEWQKVTALEHRMRDELLKWKKTDPASLNGLRVPVKDMAQVLSSRLTAAGLPVFKPNFSPRIPHGQGARLECNAEGYRWTLRHLAPECVRDEENA